MIIINQGPNNSKVLLLAANLANTTKQGIRKGLWQSGIDIAGKQGSNNGGLIKQDMAAKKSGRIYQTAIGRGGRVLKRLRTHQASAAGEAPAILTGALRNSVYFRVQGNDQLRIGADTPYARELEESSRNYLFKNIQKGRRNIINNIENALK